MPRKGWWLVLLLAGGCSTQRYFQQPIHQSEADFKGHIGFVVYDPLKKKTIYSHQGDRYFIPASNTKIFTFYAALMTLGDSIPGLQYEQRNDSLIVWGTGDPGFLYQNTYRNPRVYDFLKQSPSRIFFSSANAATEYLGPGWAWDDHNDYYQVERTSFPIYGNLATIRKSTASFSSFPDVFRYSIADSVKQGQRAKMDRAFDANEVTYFPGRTDRRQWYIPFRVSDPLLAKLLSDTLRREVSLVGLRPTSRTRVLYSAKADSLYKVMMQTSDNFIAEQLMMMVGHVAVDTLSVKAGIRYAKTTLLPDLPDELVWVDGSGLSRYNLFTPRSIVRVWEKIYQKVSWERLRVILPAAGKSGTPKNSSQTERPFIIGKSGSLTNQYCLSGYLVTKRGRTLIFSWMNNNFAGPTSAVRGRMETVLRNIYENY